MSKIRSNIDKILYIFVFIFLGIVYLLHAPHTVQTGDSGELSAAAYKLLVTHPPGYPLWIWLNHLWLNIVNAGSTYFSLATFNIICALATLWLLGKNLPTYKSRIITVLCLGSSYLFWKFSMLPEVFILNLLLAFAVIYTGNLKTTWGKQQIPASSILMPLIFSLGIANHHTIVFMMPYIAWVCWSHRKTPWLYISTLSGILLCTFLYATILGMNPNHPYSWGNIHNFVDVWGHFLRKEYGTLELHPNPNEDSLHLLALFFVEQVFLTALPLMVFCVFCLITNIRKGNKLVWSNFNTGVSLSLLAYLLIFIPMMKMAPLFTREEIVERFLLLPIALATFISGKFLSDNYDFSKKNSITLGTVAILFAAFSISVFSHDLDYSENTILADYAENILHIAAEFKNPILMISQDSQNFATRYTQIVENVEPQVFVTSSFSKILDHKVLAAFPRLILQSPETTKNELKDVILKNENHMTFISNEDDFPTSSLKLTYLPLGVRLSTGSGVGFLKTRFTPQFRSDISIVTKPYSKFDLYRNAFFKYSYFFFEQGTYNMKSGNSKKAIDDFERTLGITPFHKQALQNLCKVKFDLKIEDAKCSQPETSELWFNYLKFNKGT